MTKRQLFIQWDSTNDCNLRCRHCYHNREGNKNHSQEKKKLMNLAEVKEMVDDLALTSNRWNMSPRLHISGGEPLMRRDLLDILEYTFEKKVTTKLLTNGTLVTKKKAREIKKRGVNRVQISIDGNREKHNFVRQREYAFDKAMEGISNCKEEGIGVTVSFTAMQSNKSYIEQAIKESIDAGAQMFGVQSYVPSLDLGINDPEFIDSKGLYEIYLSQRELSKKYGEKIGLLETEVLWGLMHEDDSLREKSRKEEKYLGGCGAGFSGVSVLSNGRVYPCRRLPLDMGHIQEGLVNLIIEKKIMQDLRNFKKIKKNVRCEYVPHCKGCRAIAYATTGDYLSKDPMCFRNLIKSSDISNINIKNEKL